MADNNEHKNLNVPPLRFPGFVGEWERIRVSDLLTFYSTNSLSWEQLDYESGRVKNLHYGLIHKGLGTLVNLTSNQLPFIKEDFMPRTYTLCIDGDVAFADASEDTADVGKSVEFVDCNKEPVVCGLHTIHGRDKTDKTVIGYKGYAFGSEAFHKQLRRLAQGTKIYSINARNFDEMHIGVPSKAEQSKIASLLSLIDQRIAVQIRLIERLKSLIGGIVVNIPSSSCKWVYLSEVLTERSEINAVGYDVYSVSVAKGVVNQMDYLGRSFAAKDTSNYHVVHYDDIIYTKSPTGDFPYGIIKRSSVAENVAVSPLYGVYIPTNHSISTFLHHYFCSSTNAKNYLHSLIQKGAKNTINITNQRFLENRIRMPNDEMLPQIASLLEAIAKKVDLEIQLLNVLNVQKAYLLRQMFI